MLQPGISEDVWNSFLEENQNEEAPQKQETDDDFDSAMEGSDKPAVEYVEPVNEEQDKVMSSFFKNAKNMGLELDQESYKGKRFSGDEARAELRKQVALDEMRGQDPVAAKAIESGVNPTEYYAQYNNIKAKIETSVVELGKEASWYKIWNDEVDNDTLPTEENAAKQHVMRLLEAHINRVGEKGLTKSGNQYKEHLVSQLESLGGAMKQDQEVRVSQYKEQHAKQNDAFFKDQWTKSFVDAGGVLPYSAKGERDEFEKYAREQFVMSEQSGMTKFVERLSTEKEFAMNVIRLAHALDTGKLKNIQRKAKSSAFEEMDMFVSPAGGSGKNEKTRYKDTSKPH